VANIDPKKEMLLNQKQVPELLPQQDAALPVCPARLNEKKNYSKIQQLEIIGHS